MNARAAKVPVFLTELMTHAAAVTAAHGIARDRCVRIAEDLATKIRQSWGGQIVYFPIARSADQAKRDAAIVGEFDGHNQADLARKHGVSVKTVYAAIRRNSSKGATRAVRVGRKSGRG